MLKGKVGQAHLVALIPQREKVDPESGTVLTPLGMHIVELPFAESIRSVAKPSAIREADFTPEQLHTARELVSSLRMPSGKSPVGRVANPATATHYNYLECLALHVPGAEVTSTVDGTLPDEGWFNSKRKELDAFKKAFGLPDTQDENSSAAAKRVKTASGASKAGPSAPPPETLEEWMKAYSEQRLEGLTMPKLKEFLKSQGLSLGGKKNELVARVHDQLAQMVGQSLSKRADGPE